MKKEYRISASISTDFCILPFAVLNKRTSNGVMMHFMFAWLWFTLSFSRLDV